MDSVHARLVGGYVRVLALYYGAVTPLAFTLAPKPCGRCSQLRPCRAWRAAGWRSPGQGSRFTARFKLPRASGETSQIAQAALAAVQADPLSILVAEDHPALWRVLEVMLEAAGMRCISVADGLEAIEARFASEPDLVLMNIQLPGLGGLAAI